MENDLITKGSVLKLIEDIKTNPETPKNYGTLLDIMREVRKIPTAFDVDKIIETLEKYKQQQCENEVLSYNGRFIAQKVIEECTKIIRPESVIAWGRKEIDRMSISEQVKELREFKIEWLSDVSRAAGIMKQAADTIEALSAKLAAANMERSDGYYGNFIDKDKLLEDLIPILNENGDMYFAGRIIGLIDNQSQRS